MMFSNIQKKLYVGKYVNKRNTGIVNNKSHQLNVVKNSFVFFIKYP